MSGLERLTLAGIAEAFEGPDILSKNELRKFCSIVHGDLIARNLTWADALGSFFLIDFEHVGPGLKGTDQFRLAANTVTELFTSWIHERPDEDNSPLWDALDAGTGFLALLFEHLMSGAAPLDATTQHLVEKHDGGQGISLVLSSILQTASTCDTDLGTNQGTAEWRKFWAYVLYCAVLKEFEYSCRRVDAAAVKTLLANGVDLCSDSLGNVYQALGDLLRGGGNTEEEGYYIRHFVAARILKPIAETLFS